MARPSREAGADARGRGRIRRGRTLSALEGELALDAALRAELVRRARAALPLEACGLLLGTCSESGVQVRAVREGRNRAASAHSFELEPEDHLAIQLEATRLGLDVVGVWHSHPRGLAQPSKRDLREALPGWSNLIVGLAAEGPEEVRSWRLRSGQLVEERIGSRNCSLGGTPVTAP